MPKLTSFHDGDSGFSKAEHFEHYAAFEVTSEKQSFFENPADGTTYRIYDERGLHATYISGANGSYTTSEKLFDVRRTIAYEGNYGGHYGLEASLPGQNLLQLQALYSFSMLGVQSIVAIRGLDLIRTTENREVSIAGMRNGSVLTAKAPVWKDSDTSRGVLFRIHVRKDLTGNLCDLLLLGAMVRMNPDCWHTLIEDRL
ncbi:MAG: hypothetical protein GC165_11135 [Armatimonadetes bacterium]|nr:hypothetical protein [Armatimonadota bacterium]